MNLITGATGLVGAHVMLSLLRQGKPVVAMKRKESDVEKVQKIFSYYSQIELYKKISWVDGDVLDVFSVEQALENIETVYHCAGYISFNEDEREVLFKINAEGTANVVNACIHKKIKAFCHVSSTAALQNTDVKAEVNENIFWKPSGYESAYSISKYLGEREAWRGSEEGLNTVIVNPGVIIGPGPWHQGSGKLISQSAKGIKFYTSGVTGFIDAKDVGEIMVQLVEKKKFNERFILIENNYSFKEILEWTHSALNKKPPVMQAGKLTLMVARFFSAILPVSSKITRSTAQAAITKTYFSNQKIKTVLNFSFTPIRDCISFTCKAYLS